MIIKDFVFCKYFPYRFQKLDGSVTTQLLTVLKTMRNRFFLMRKKINLFRIS